MGITLYAGSGPVVVSAEQLLQSRSWPSSSMRFSIRFAATFIINKQQQKKLT